MGTPADRLRNFGFLIKDIGRLYTKLFESEAEPLGINLAEAKVLVALSRNAGLNSAGLNQVQLAELSGIEPMSLVRILDRMEGDRWIERRPHPTDRRARHIHLKAQAQPTLDEIWKVVAQIRTQALADFDAEERNALVEQLTRVHVKMSRMLGQDGSGLQKTSSLRSSPRQNPSSKSLSNNTQRRTTRSTVKKPRRAVR